MLRNLLSELGLVGGATATLLAAFPHHAVAVGITVVVSWVLVQLWCAYSFMAALYHGDIVEYRTNPRTYALASRAVVNWRARRFMMSYLRIAKPRSTRHPVPDGNTVAAAGPNK